ncbi:uncharacterized protein LOC114522090 [Dendronephthya gigantea]|uniref:uncharacterized protein LOC114522090 n=1 Tax=Dendronephthya gigantea TaxID=151771 RepID=UPI00106CD315|nr:uncharacterized protein LOC114522090 [Dendronephthya gigantea]
MMRNYELEGNATLSCPLNKLISDIAKKATFNQVSPTNTLGLNTCLSCSKTLQVVNDGAYLSMSCLPGATCTPWNTTLDRKVFLLCVKPPQVNSTFHIDEVRFVKHRDRKYASVRVSMPNGEESIHNDWCTDYQKICESLSMRPIAGGRSYERLMGRRKCRIKYNAVMLEEFGLPNYDLIADISRAAGFNYNEDMVFSLNDCNSCSRKIFTSEGVDKITSTSSFQYTTACTYSDSNFEELQRRNVTVDGKSYLVVKAQLPADMLSSHKTWCKDYQMMCESYGKRPLTCVEGTDFQTNYNSLFLTHSCDSSIPKQAGFADATDENTLMFKSNNGAKCSRKLPSADGPFGRLNSNVPHRLVYALCLNSATAFEVLAKKWHDEQSSTYLFLQVAMPENGIANYNTWCHDYRELCREYGMRPVSCSEYYCRTQHGALRKLDDVCPLDKMVSLAEKAQITEVKSTTSFLYSFTCNTNNCKKVVETRNCTARGKKIPLCFDRDENNGEFTTVCSWPKEQTRFSTLDVKYVRYLGRPYTVIRTRKTSRVSLQNNWCNDYKHLCRSFMQRPLACPARYNTDAEHHLCQRNYEGVSMETDDHECPMNKFVAELAQYAGFSRATPQNSFAFRDCKDAFCKNQLPTGECSEALYCVNMLGDQEDLYTACVSGDSAFNVRRYKFNVNYNYDNYGVIKVTISEGLKSAHEDWCKDYQRLCESWNMEAVQCATGLELASDICSINYGAHQRLSSCAADAKAIATKAQLGSVADKTALVMDGCKYCSNIVTKTCSSSLNCLRSGTLFAVCAMQKQVDAFKPVQTRFVNYGNTAYLLIQSYLHSRQSHSFMNAYNNLCEQIYGYQPILCGRDAVDGSSSYRSCRDSYPNALSHQGNDFICPPAKTIAFIAQRFGFHRALHSSSFAFYQCSHYYYYRWSYGYQLSTSSCNNRVWCLMWNQYYMLHYTMCAVPKLSPSLGFHVLDKKELIFLGIKYVAFKLSLGTSGVSATDNWCYDYRELCRKYNMVPTGCGTSKKKESGYLQCSSKYRSFMSHRNAVGCGKNPAPSSLARRAGFPDASEQNTFVFNDCSKCAKNLPPTSCDSALTCLYSEVFNKHAYTLCVERKSGFEYVAKKTTIYGGVEYSVVKSALPVDNRPLYDNWCVDYQKLCYSVGAFPVACSLASGVQDLRRFAEKYGAITVESIPCPPIAKVLAIVKKAGYSNAVSGNSFVFTGQSSAECSKDLPTAHCTPGLDCLNQQFREVYAVCTNPTNFAVSDVRTSWHSGNTFTVVEATLPTSGLSKTSSWCEDYATLCRSMKQQPVVCAGHADSKQYEKCRDNYHGYLLFDKYNCNTEKRLLYQIAQFAGFAKGNFGNTIGFASCASCTRELHVGPECDSSLNCVNNQTADRLAYAVCLRESEHSGFQVVETKDTATSEVEYKVVKAIASPFGKSKYDTWCKDYERMCSSLEMRPVRCSSSDGSTCPLLHKALVSPQENFDCEDNAGLLKFVKSVGYSEATQNNTFIFGACSTAEKCRKTLLDNSCDGSMNCLKKQPGSRLIFTLCARGRHTSFRYLDSSVHVHQGIHFLVIKASKFSDESKSINWCYDYRNMCVSFGRQPIVFGSFGQHFNNDRNQCFAAYNATSTMVNINSYQTILSEMSIPVSNCRVVYTYCKNCIKTFQHCPFRACNCDLFYLFCL